MDLIQVARDLGLPDPLAREPKLEGITPMFKCPYCKKPTIFPDGHQDCQPTEKQAA